MTARFTLTPRAQGDLSDIWDHTANRWGIDQAETYTRQLGVHVAMVAGNPALGRACPEVRMGYYKFQSGKHILFYRIMNNGIEVVRVLHERMDYGQHL
ncbi:type II toxin-antitoxin system RelE/ParE family toxin [Acidisoma sp. L85]|jgi:toxin ParE1/3/4|uniref:type II toxin-antitoxin system RelE/ParE family toxin n=1 Tax=Acidisoma sp. L85 TaxID=1641850 RepID=UPI00131D5222|nr:type II toxin-antitoxin system RelE/ParE family toxin [Acidisoma sp. L85]